MIDWIRDKVASETCYLCHNKFTKENKLTLDRIDNSIGHTKQNCQLACQICNTVKADKDNDIRFESFACTMMSKRQDAISQHNDTKSLYYKQILNSAFGGEGQNNAKFDKISINNARQASIKQLKQDHKATRKLSDDIYNSDGDLIEEAQYMVSESPRQFKCNMPLQEAVFTLDNSKFWNGFHGTIVLQLKRRNQQVSQQNHKVKTLEEDQDINEDANDSIIV
ncbi:MAG: hypothetical protein EZS28_013553 [Streblomastix strix]|uniref:Uncharacterized protein n=1 Tax=Streblomastix strix TaxID=222440 RepID=A0A5J4W9A2_9EUKA|nr:MAG: hypothetical protein EZS28_013553 [Streblomastix strix]